MLTGAALRDAFYRRASDEETFPGCPHCQADVVPSWHHLSWAGTGEERSQIQPWDDLRACLAWPQAACSAARSAQVLSRFSHCRGSAGLRCLPRGTFEEHPTTVSPTRGHRHLRTVGLKGLRSSTGSASWRHFGHHHGVRKGVRKGHVPYTVWGVGWSSSGKQKQDLETRN